MTVKELIKLLDEFDGHKEVKYDSEINGTSYSISGVEQRRGNDERSEFVLIL